MTHVRTLLARLYERRPDVHAKHAGAQAAMAQYGLTHGTPAPPAPWTQGWQNTEHKKVTKKVTIPSRYEEKP